MSFNEWKEYSFDELIDIIGGGTPKTTVEEYWNGHIPWLSVKDFNTDNRTVYETEKTITELGLQKSSTKLLNKGDLIISARGTVGALAQLGRQMAFNQSCYGLRANSKTTNNFLYYLLKYKLRSIQSNTHGSVFSTITKDTFKVLKAIIPIDIEEQKAIAKVLSDLDEKIETNNKINKTLEEMAQAIFKQWFIDFEFTNEEGKPYRSSGGEMVESELGMIPKGWEISELGKIIELFDFKRIPLSKNEREKREKIYPYYGAAALMDYVDNYIFDGIYILMGEDGTVVNDDGYPILQYVWGKFWVNNHAHVIKGKCNIPDEFIYILLRNTNVKTIVTGAVQPKINQQNLKSLKIVLPSDKKMLVEYENIVKRIFEQIRVLADENEKLISIRDTLLPKLMSGEIRVPLE